ncbi:MAG: PAS domain-containing protein [Planctomycetota bacterium]|nr:PAS domain-containing protein [Planctomycetota bacterium]
MAVKNCIAYVHSSRFIAKKNFLARTERIQQERQRLESSWLAEYPQDFRFSELIVLLTRIVQEGSDLIKEKESGRKPAASHIAEYRLLGLQFAVLVDESIEFSGSRIQEADARMESGRRAINILNGVAAGFAVSLTFVVPFLLRSWFENYLSIRDTLEKRKMESEDRFRKIFENEPQCIKLFGPEGNLLDMNPAGLAMIEADSLESVLGACVYDLVDPRHRDDYCNATARAFQGECQSFEFEIIGLKGTRRSMETWQVPLKNDEGEIASVLAITHDLTKRKLAEAELREHRESMIFASRVNMMGELASNMAHELNQPLTSVVNFAYCLL